MDNVDRLPEIIFLIVLSGMIVGTGALIFGQLSVQTVITGTIVNETIDMDRNTGSFANTPVITITRFVSNTSDVSNPLLVGAIEYNESTNSISINSSVYYNTVSMVNETMTFVNGVSTVSFIPVIAISRFASNESDESTPVTKGAISFVASTGVITLNTTAFPQVNGTHYIWYTYQESQEGGNFDAWYTFTANTSSSDIFRENQTMILGYSGWMGLIITVVIIGLVLSVIIYTLNFGQNR